MGLKKRLMAILVAGFMMLAVIPFTTLNVYAKSSKSPALIKSVMVYDYNYGKHKWEKTQKRTFTYKKKYPKKQSIYDYDSKMKVTKTFKYTFRGKLPKKMTMKRSDTDTPDKYEYTKKGLVSRIITGPDKDGRRTKVFSYGTKYYFTTMLHDNIWVEYNDNGESAYEYAEEIDSVTVTPRKNGLLKKTVNRGLFANYSYAEKRKWERFYGTYTVNYDNNGIVQQTSAKFRAFPGSGPQLKFKVSRQNGLITSVIRYNWNPDANKGKGTWEKSQKVVFKYTNQKISKIRYASMINSQIMDESNNYYMYNWY